MEQLFKDNQLEAYLENSKRTLLSTGTDEYLSVVPCKLALMVLISWDIDKDRICII